MTLYEVPAPAKINLFLHVVGRRADGYHALQTVFRFIDLADTLHFELRRDGAIVRTDALPGVTFDTDLTVRAARLLQTTTGVRLGASIGLEKRIPMGGGLGGGSSDAATTLIALNRLWRTGLSRSELLRLAGSLGADVPVFVFGQSAFAEGRGDILSAVSLPERTYLIAQPDVSVPTALVFSDPHLMRATDYVKMESFVDFVDNRDVGQEGQRQGQRDREGQRDRNSQQDRKTRVRRQGREDVQARDSACEDSSRGRDSGYLDSPGSPGVHPNEVNGVNPNGVNPNGANPNRPGYPYFGRNDLEPVVYRRFPEIGRAAHWLEKQLMAPAVGHAIAVRLSGSGACLFTEFADRKTAILAEQKIVATMRVTDKTFSMSSGTSHTMQKSPLVQEAPLRFRLLQVCPGLIEHPLRHWTTS
jgi:4-diphosphocytidyl-2C-methyl-D-erythritol kinase